MKKSGTDPKVKKTMIRNYEQKVIHSKLPLPYNVTAGCSETLVNKTFSSKKIEEENILNRPTTCSSEVLASYLLKAKKDVPSQTYDDKKDEYGTQLGSKITKKLNFHLNDKIYRNLVELNANAANLKSNKDRKTSKMVTSIKKDVEPNIEDFYSTEKEEDLYPDVPVVKPKLKRISEYESKDLHNLVAAFENL